MTFVATVLWVSIGVVAGWLASLFLGTRNRQGTSLDVAAGVLGAFIGGTGVQHLFAARLGDDAWVVSIMSAVGWALLTLLLWRWVEARPSATARP